MLVQCCLNAATMFSMQWPALRQHWLGKSHSVESGRVWMNERGFCPPLCRPYIQAKLGQENHLIMVRWMRWHYPTDTGFEMRALAVWRRARYLSVTEALYNTEYLGASREETFCFQSENTPTRFGRLGMSGGKSLRHAQNPLSGEREKRSQ